MMLKDKKWWDLGAALSLAAAMGLAAPVAEAALSVDPFTATAGNVVVPPGGPGVQAMPTLSLTFDAAYDLAAFTLNMDFDHTLMTFNSGASTVSSGSFSASLVDALGILMSPSGGAFTIFPPNIGPGSFSVTGFSLGSLPIPASTVVFAAVFDVMPALTPGMSTNVTFSGNLGNAAFDPPTEFSKVASVTAVPEPETWLMLLGGLGLIAARVRRRQR